MSKIDGEGGEAEVMIPLWTIKCITVLAHTAVNENCKHPCLIIKHNNASYMGQDYYAFSSPKGNDHLCKKYKYN